MNINDKFKEIEESLRILEDDSMTFYGEVDESKTVRAKTFSISEDGIIVDGERIEKVFRIQMDVRKAKRMYVIDSYGEKPTALKDRVYVYRLIVKY